MDANKYTVYNKFGNLEYRSVRFENAILDILNYRGNAAVNYTDSETPWTRIIEHKWFEFGKDANGNDIPKTVISKEYRKLADQEEKVIFGGRLGKYKYYDMDAVIESALEFAGKELGK